MVIHGAKSGANGDNLGKSFDLLNNSSMLSVLIRNASMRRF